MKKLYLISLTAVAALAVVAACKRVPVDGATATAAGAVPSGPAPKLVFASLSHDFGTVISGETVETVFTFKNEGEGELRLEQPRGS